MTGQRILGSVVIVTVALWAMACRANAAEHPAEQPAEHPKAAKQEVKKAEPVTKEELAKAIEEYVKKDARLKGGYFLVYDKVAKKALVLTLDKVHKKRLATLGHQKYFACADFRTPEGKVYDLDIFMKGPSKDQLKVKKITVHKEDGKARYTWYEEGGVWKMKPAGEGVEHPKKHEHPKKEKTHSTEHPQ